MKLSIRCILWILILGYFGFGAVGAAQTTQTDIRTVEVLLEGKHLLSAHVHVPTRGPLSGIVIPGRVNDFETA